MTTIDFKQALQEAKGASMDALPIGDYDVEVAKSEATVSSNGKPMIKVSMKVVGGPYERRTVLNQFVMSQDNPVALSIFFRHMRAFGLDEQFFMSLGRGSIEPVANALLGRRARLTLGHREWQGETRNEVKAVKPYTGAPTAGPAAGPVSTPGPVAPPLAPPPPAPVTTPIAPVATSQPVAPAPQPVPISAQPVAQPVAQPAAQPVQPPTPPQVEQPAPVAAVPTDQATSPSSTEPTAASPTPATSEPQPELVPAIPGPTPPGADDAPELPF